MTLVPNIALLVGAAAGGGKFTPAAPTLSYAGSGTTNNGKFTITNYDSTYIYTATGGTVASNVLTVTDATGSAVLTAKSPKGLTQSASITAYRQAAVLITVPYIQCYNPCGDCNYPYTSWTCGCGSGCNDSGGGQWGNCICRGPGYTYYQNFSSSGYTWSGSDYTNGQGEWWKIA